LFRHVNSLDLSHRFILNIYVNKYVTAMLNTMNAMKIPTSLHLFEYLILNERSKNSSVVLNEQNWQAEVESGLVR